MIRASYGVMFTHGNAVGGLEHQPRNTGLLRCAVVLIQRLAVEHHASPRQQRRDSGLCKRLGHCIGPCLRHRLHQHSGYTGTPSTMQYNDPYLGGRAPEYINWTFGLQRQLTDSTTMTITYVGSQGHFLQTDGGNGRGYWSDQLDPKYLSLGTA